MNAARLLHRRREIALETAVGGALLGLVLAGTTGCKVHVDKTEDGKNIKIATPFGNIAVNKDEATPADLGLPSYPGATLDNDNDGNKSARVDLGFGSFKLRVKMAHYVTHDSRDQVLSFYRRALSEYGSVIECAGGEAVGAPVSSGQGLSCDHSRHDDGMPDGKLGAGDVELKAGSERHQHIVVVKEGASPATRFTMVALDLPHGIHSDDKGTN